jgi:hypothetical protein
MRSKFSEHEVASSQYGPQYRNDLLVGDANYGNIYDFNLDEQRMNLDVEVAKEFINSNEKYLA